MANSEIVVMKQIESEYEVEILRTLRNECRNFMTRHTNVISKEQQLNWWNKLDKDKHKLFLLQKVLDGVVGVTIGYGYVRVENGEVLLTGGLSDNERGKGHGTQLFKYMVEYAKQFNLPIKLELLKTNTRAFTVYNSIGFRVIGDDGQNIYMEYYYDSVI